VLVAPIEAPTGGVDDDELTAEASLKSAGGEFFSLVNYAKRLGTYEKNGPWYTVARFVLVLPPLRRHHLAHRVADEPHGVHRQLLCMA
jgi:hypothetical protein